MSDLAAAIAMAHAAIQGMGLTPCKFSQFTHAGRVFAFSEESATGLSELGPAFEVVVDIETGEIIRMGERGATTVRWLYSPQGSVGPALLVVVDKEQGVSTTLYSSGDYGAMID